MRSNKEMIQNIGSVPSLKTIEDRNQWSLKVAETYRVPKFNWTIEEDTGDITVWAQGPILPKTVTLWHVRRGSSPSFAEMVTSFGLPFSGCLISRSLEMQWLPGLLPKSWWRCVWVDEYSAPI